MNSSRNTKLNKIIAPLRLTKLQQNIHCTWFWVKTYHQCRSDIISNLTWVYQEDYNLLNRAKVHLQCKAHSFGQRITTLAFHYLKVHCPINVTILMKLQLQCTWLKSYQFVILFFFRVSFLCNCNIKLIINDHWTNITGIDDWYLPNVEMKVKWNSKFSPSLLSIGILNSLTFSNIREFKS